jgi:putative ABC transport system permease protein
MNAKEPAWRRYTRFWGARVDADVDDELAFHAEMRARDYRDRGLGDAEAHAAALARLGNVRDIRSACLTIGHRRQRRMTRTQIVDAFVQDLRYALRTLGRSRGWTAVALTTLALGIGASTTVFSVIENLVLHPLPYADADRVVTIWRVNATMGMSLSPSAKTIDAFKKSAQSFEAIEAFQSDQVTLSGRGETARLDAARISATFTRFTGMSLRRGRSFVAEETVPGGRRAAMVSEAIARERFGSETDALGQQIVVDDLPYVIVGVTPARMRLPGFSTSKVDVWLPMIPTPTDFAFFAVGRVRKGVSLVSAQEELKRIAARANVDGVASLRSFAYQVARPNEALRFRSSLYLLAGAVGLLLIIACANVAHLLIARGATRQREIAVRTALGAGRGRLIRQLLTESLLIAGVGCVLGIGVAVAGVKLLVSLRPERLTELELASVNGTVLWGAVALSVITGIAFGLTAAIHGVRRTTSDALRATGSSGTSERATQRLRSVLVVTEMALSAMLLVGAALLVRSVSKLERVDPGFPVANLYALQIDLPSTRYDSAARPAFVRRIRDAVRQLGGVKSAAIASSAPPSNGYMVGAIEAEGSDYGTRAPAAIAMNNVEPNYFSTLGLPMVAGSTFGPGASQRNDLIINEGFAKKLWPGKVAAGRRIRFPGPPGSPPGPWQTVVGVASDVVSTASRTDREAPLLYFPRDNREPGSAEILIRVAPGFDPVVPIRQILSTADPRLPPARIQTVSAGLAATFATQRFTMQLLAAFAGFAVVLSGIGLYGVIAYVVTQRQREIGVRLALGATPSHVARVIVVKGLVVSLVGLAIGLTAATWGSKLVQTALFGVTGKDPLSYVAAAALLLAVSILACLVPMRRAMSVDPAIAMRGD